MGDSAVADPEGPCPRRLGATIDVDSLAGWGTRIRARFPYRHHDEQAGPRLRRLHIGAKTVEKRAVRVIMQNP